MDIPTAPLAHYLFDALAWGSAALAGRWVWVRQRAHVDRLERVTGPGYFVALAIGAVAGAWLFGSLNSLNSATPSLSHSIAGALAGAIFAVEIWKWRHKVTGSTGGGFVVPICTGIVVGRFGCLFSGLPDGTYGVATALPWGVDLGDGIARHPVQLYESGAMLAFLMVYLAAFRRGRDWPMRRGFHVMIIVYALQRFMWEFLKPYPTLAGPFNLFHFLMLGLLVYGLVWIDRGPRAQLQR
jgi:hypothetical protein